MTIDAHSAPEDSAANSDDAGAAPSCEQTGIKALAAVARHLGLDWSLPRLVHVYGKEHEPDAGELVRIARAEGLKARTYQTDWPGLERFQKLAPFLVRLKDGGYFIVSRMAPPPDTGTREEIFLFNPRVPQTGLFAVSANGVSGALDRRGAALQAHPPAG